jgi:hypothetical protein
LVLLLRQGFVLVCGLIVALAATPVVPSAVGRAEGAAVACKGYSYAGLQGWKPVSGLRATIRVVRTPSVGDGHVGGWIGIGGPRLGPGGSDQWLQAGYAGFGDGRLQMYYEITLPGQAAAYHMLKEQAAAGETHTISIQELPGQGGRWRVWLDGEAASPVYNLKGSHGKYMPQGIGENWTPSSKCNTFDWLFTNVRVLLPSGRARWTIGSRTPPYKWQDTGYKVKLIPPDSFETRSIRTG